MRTTPNHNWERMPLGPLQHWLQMPTFYKTFSWHYTAFIFPPWRWTVRCLHCTCESWAGLLYPFVSYLWCERKEYVCLVYGTHCCKNENAMVKRWFRTTWKSWFLSQYFIYQQSPRPISPLLAHLVLLLTPGQNVTGFKLKYFTCCLREQTTISGKQQGLKLTYQVLTYTDQFRKKKSTK